MSDPIATPPGRRLRGSVALIIVTLAVVALALFMATQVLSVLVGIVSPPDPPLPEGAVRVSASSAAYGVDDRVYSVPESACAVLDVYIAQGASCRVAPLQCGSGGSTLAGGVGMVARCYGTAPFSIFDQAYEAIISRGQQGGDTTELRLFREVYWLGSAPDRSLAPTANP